MTAKSPLSPASSNKPPVNGREQLQRALAQGNDGFKWQLRYIMMICQIGKPKPTAPDNPRPQPLQIMRLESLLRLYPLLNATQRTKLAQEILAIPEEGLRLPLLAKLATFMPPDKARGWVAQVWSKSDLIADLPHRAHALYDIAPMLGKANSPNVSVPSALGRVAQLAQTFKHPEARIRGLVGIVPHLEKPLAQALINRLLTELESSRSDTLTAKAMTAVASHLPQELIEQALKVAESIKHPIERARAITALIEYAPATHQTRLRQAGLNAIDKIEGEDDRAEAFIAFAPYLETASKEAFPALLEQALTTTILISRRPTRARMLVSLAPHLTPDLQGEAIASVNGLTNERERATLLAQLAPTLPANMLVASLAVAYTMREQDSRVHALSALAHYAPESARHQTMLDALAAASNLPHHYERVRALVGLIDILPNTLRHQALTNALESTRLIDNENARARSLHLLGAHLSRGLLLRALDVARELKNAEQRLNALLGLIAHLPQEAHYEVTQDMLACVVSMPLEYKRARALVNLAPHVDAQGLIQLEELAHTLSDSVDRLNAYVAILQRTAPQSRPPIVRRAWELIEQIELGYERANALASLAPYLPSEQQNALNAPIFKILEAIDDHYDKASAIAMLAPYLRGESPVHIAPVAPDRWSALQRGLEIAVSIPYPTLRAQVLERGAVLWSQHSHPERAFSAWVTLAPLLTSLPLNECVQAIGALLPLIKDFGGTSALEDVAQLLGLR